MAYILVLGRRIELLWCHHRRILSPLRLPVPPPEQEGRMNLSIIRGCPGQDKEEEGKANPSSFFNFKPGFTRFPLRNRGTGKVP